MRHKQHTPRLSNTRQCVFVWRTGTKTRSQKKNHVTIPLSFPGWLVSVLAAQCCPERLAPCFPHHHVLFREQGNERRHGANAWD